MRSFQLKLAAAILVILQLRPLPAAVAQNAPVPEECEAVAVWESSREDRIEQEFQRRGILNSVDKQLHRAEVEKVVDQRIASPAVTVAKQRPGVARPDR